MWSWWTPNNYHFADYEALWSFLWRYVADKETHPLLLLAAMLSVNSTDYDSIGWRSRLYLKNFLAPYGLSMEEIITTSSASAN